jgi:transposase InsO family protein
MFTICSRARNRKRNRKLQIRNQNQPLTDDLVRLLPKAEWLAQHIFATIEEARDHATRWLWTYNNERPNMANGGLTPAQKLKNAA